MNFVCVFFRRVLAIHIPSVAATNNLSATEDIWKNRQRDWSHFPVPWLCVGRSSGAEPTASNWQFLAPHRRWKPMFCQTSSVLSRRKRPSFQLRIHIHAHIPGYPWKSQSLGTGVKKKMADHCRVQSRWRCFMARPFDVRHHEIGRFGSHRISSCNLTVCYWQWPSSSWVFPLKMVIFQSYVSLPESILNFGMLYSLDISPMAGKFDFSPTEMPQRLPRSLQRWDPGGAPKWESHGFDVVKMSE